MIFENIQIFNMVWGHKTVAIFDVWSIDHLLTGTSIGAFAVKINKKVFENQFHINQIETNYFDLISVLFVAYIWETIEHYLEIGIAGVKIEYWFQGVEYWANRIISDPLLTVMGYYIAKVKPDIVNIVRSAALLWLFFHIFIFPHSMYLQEILFQ